MYSFIKGLVGLFGPPGLQKAADHLHVVVGGRAQQGVAAKEVGPVGFRVRV